MYDSGVTYRPRLNPGGLGAATLVIIALAALYWRFSGDGAPDWTGYGRLFDDEGGWLLRTGREPGFVWLISRARDLFGEGGYSNFRFSLFCLFTLFAARLAYRIPDQKTVAPVTSIVVAIILVTTFLLKSLIQIREGVAFLFVVAPMFALFGQHKARLLRTGVFAAIAGVIHAATLIFTAAWIAAVAIRLLPDRVLATRRFQWAIFVAAALTGIVIALTVLRNIEAVDFLLQDFGVDRRADAFGVVWKYLYWVSNGVFVFVVRHQLIASVNIAPKFAFAYATAIGSVALPAIYMICLVLVGTNFNIGAVTSMAVRLFFTTSELAMVIIAIRGRANLVTLALAIVMLADRARLLAIP